MNHPEPEEALSLLGLDLESIRSLFKTWDEPVYRADQVFDWTYRKLEPSFDAMSNVPRSLRDRLASRLFFPTSRVVTILDDAQEQTAKLLIELEDGERVECVALVNRNRGPTLCVSSQVGCPMACVFCATGLMGSIRNLTTDEILAQIFRGLIQLAKMGVKPETTSGTLSTNVVFMGMGEPLVNTVAVFGAIKALTDPDRFGIGARRITVSTVGVTKGIRQLTKLQPRVNLAFSLHHADPRARQALIEKSFSPLDELMLALKDYAKVSGRLVTFEYVLLDGINDSDDQARLLVRLMESFGYPHLVNIIPYNPVRGLPYNTPSRGRIQSFMGILESSGIRVTRRRTQGTRIDAACGQLARTGYEPSETSTGKPLEHSSQS